MENYYKERKKQQTLYSKKIKKMTETGDKDLPRLKKEYVKWSIQPPTFERGEYWMEEDVLKEVSKRIREAEEEFITLKLDLCYDLSDDLDAFEPLEKKIMKLNKTRDKLFAVKQKRELDVEMSKKEIKDQLKGLLDSYPYLETEDKKTTYSQMNELSSKLANPNSQVIAYEIEHKELEYRLTQLYEPLVLLKIS